MTFINLVRSKNIIFLDHFGLGGEQSEKRLYTLDKSRCFSKDLRKMWKSFTRSLHFLSTFPSKGFS